MFKDQSTYDQVEKLKDTASNVATSKKVTRQLRHVRCHVGEYAEPGYSTDDDVDTIVAGNWNNDTDYKDGDWIVNDDTMGRFADLLEKIGCELVWGDEWDRCVHCMKLVRTVGDSYSWKPYYKATMEGIVCADCIKEDFEHYIPEFANNPDTALTFDVDLEEHGFEKYNGQFDNGLYQHQQGNPRPEDVYDRLKDYYETVIFKMDSTGQFDVNWSAWVKGQYDDSTPE